MTHQLCLPNPNPELSGIITRHLAFIRYSLRELPSNHLSLNLNETELLLAYYISLRSSMIELLKTSTLTPWRNPIVYKANNYIVPLYTQVCAAYQPSN